MPGRYRLQRAFSTLLITSDSPAKNLRSHRTAIRVLSLQLCSPCSPALPALGHPPSSRPRDPGRSGRASVHRQWRRRTAAAADAGVCLSMHQPWVSLLVYGIKRIEGRGWPTEHRGRLWIAATQQPVSQTDVEVRLVALLLLLPSGTAAAAAAAAAATVAATAVPLPSLPPAVCCSCFCSIDKRSSSGRTVQQGACAGFAPRQAQQRRLPACPPPPPPPPPTPPTPPPPQQISPCIASFTRWHAGVLLGCVDVVDCLTWVLPGGAAGVPRAVLCALHWAPPAWCVRCRSAACFVHAALGAACLVCPEILPPVLLRCTGCCLTCAGSCAAGCAHPFLSINQHPALCCFAGGKSRGVGWAARGSESRGGSHAARHAARAARAAV